MTVCYGAQVDSAYVAESNCVPVHTGRHIDRHNRHTDIHTEKDTFACLHTQHADIPALNCGG